MWDDPWRNGGIDWDNDDAGLGGERDRVGQWLHPILRLAEAYWPSLDLLWSLLRVAQDAAYDIAERSLNASAVDMVELAWDLTEAIEDIEGIRPDLAAHGLVVDAGPPSMIEAMTARDCLLAVLRLASDLSTEVAAPNGYPRCAAELNGNDLMAMERVIAKISAANARLTGREHRWTARLTGGASAAPHDGDPHRSATAP